MSRTLTEVSSVSVNSNVTIVKTKTIISSAQFHQAILGQFKLDSFRPQKEFLPTNLENFDRVVNSRANESALSKIDRENKISLNRLVKNHIEKNKVPLELFEYTAIMKNGRLQSVNHLKSQRVLLPISKSRKKLKNPIQYELVHLEKVGSPSVLQCETKTKTCELAVEDFHMFEKSEDTIFMSLRSIRVANHLKDRVFRLSQGEDLSLFKNDGEKLKEMLNGSKWERKSGQRSYTCVESKSLFGVFKLIVQLKSCFSYRTDAILKLSDDCQVVISGTFVEEKYNIDSAITVFGGGFHFLSEQTNIDFTGKKFFSEAGEVKEFSESEKIEDSMRSRFIGLLWYDADHSYQVLGNKVLKVYSGKDTDFKRVPLFVDADFGFKYLTGELPKQTEPIRNLFKDLFCYMMYVKSCLNISLEAVISYFRLNLGLDGGVRAAKVEDFDKRGYDCVDILSNLHGMVDLYNFSISEFLKPNQVDILQIISRVIRGACYKTFFKTVEVGDEMFVTSPEGSGITLRNNLLQPCLLLSPISAESMCLVVSEKESLELNNFIKSSSSGYLEFNKKKVHVFEILDDKLGPLIQQTKGNIVDELLMMRVFNNQHLKEVVFRLNNMGMLIIKDDSKFLNQLSNKFKLSNSKVNIGFCRELQVSESCKISIVNDKLGLSHLIPLIPACHESITSAKLFFGMDGGFSLYHWQYGKVFDQDLVPLKPIIHSLCRLGFTVHTKLSDVPEDEYPFSFILEDSIISAKSVIEDVVCCFSKIKQSINKRFIIRTPICSVNIGRYNGVIRVGFTKICRSSSMLTSSRRIEGLDKGNKVEVKLLNLMSAQCDINLWTTAVQKSM